MYGLSNNWIAVKSSSQGLSGRVHKWYIGIIDPVYAYPVALYIVLFTSPVCSYYDHRL